MAEQPPESNQRAPGQHQTPRSTNQILDSAHDILQSLYMQSRHLLALEGQVKQIIPEGVAVAACRNGCLTLITGSGAVATHIRYRQKEVIASLTRLTHNQPAINSLEILVRPEYVSGHTAPPKSSDTAPFISASAAKVITETAEHIDHEPLRKALLRLSQRVRP